MSREGPCWHAWAGLVVESCVEVVDEKFEGLAVQVF